MYQACLLNRPAVIRHRIRLQGVRAQLSGEVEAQQIGAAPGYMRLVPGNHERWAHDTAQTGIAAGAVVVAHLPTAR